MRVPFGIKSAPEIFQKEITNILQGIEGVENSMDDILIHAPDINTLRARTKLVLQALRNAGAKLNKEKCEFEVQKVKYLGHILSSEGIIIDPEKVEAIDRIKAPNCKKDLQRLLGMIQYLQKFIPNLSEKTHNMRLLLKKDATWNWNEELEKELSEIKNILKNAPTLTFYNPNKSLILSVDASSFAIGAVLLQEGRPIAFSSTALNENQQSYPQIEKEALAMKHGCQKFHQYIYGTDVIIETDHKPLESIFKKPIDRIPPRLRKIFLEIQQYAPKVCYKRGTEMHIADLLSRDCHNKDSLQESSLQILFSIPITTSGFKMLQDLSNTDPELLLVKHFILKGWPQNKETIPDSCKKYLPFLDELSVHNDLILKGLNIVIPQKYRSQALENLHKGHLGISSCLRRARECMFWPGMSKDIISMVENCIVCQKSQKSHPVEPMILKEIPKLPWEIVASDVFTYGDIDYLLITDSYSGFIDFKPLKDLSSTCTIEILKDWFSVHGIPRILETDNGTNYSSSEFKAFSQEWMFTHQTSSPKYPKGNGLAERAVQTAKNLLRKCKISGQDLKLALLNFRNTPRDNLGSPAQRLYSRRMRTTIPITEKLLKPEVMTDTSECLEAARQKQKYYHDLHAKQSDAKFQIGQNVMLKQAPRTWTPAKIISPAAPRSFKVMTPEGEYRRNTSAIRPTKLKFDIKRKKKIPEFPTPCESPSISDPPEKTISSEMKPSDISTPPNSKMYITRSGRTVKPTQRLDL